MYDTGHASAKCEIRSAIYFAQSGIKCAAEIYRTMARVYGF